MFYPVMWFFQPQEISFKNQRLITYAIEVMDNCLFISLLELLLGFAVFWK